MKYDQAPTILALTAAMALGSTACGVVHSEALQIQNITSHEIDISNNPVSIDLKSRIGTIPVGGTALAECVVPSWNGLPSAVRLSTHTIEAPRQFVFVMDPSTKTTTGGRALSPSDSDLTANLFTCAAFDTDSPT